MPYIDAYNYTGVCLDPIPGESYSAFMERCTAALITLQPGMTDQTAANICDEAWSAYILNNAAEVTVTMKRDFELYDDIYGVEGYWSDWKVEQIHQAALPKVNISYSSVEKARAGTGEKFKIAKSHEEQQLVFGWANIAIDANGEYPLDWDGDITAPEDLEKAAYEFVLKYRATGEQHQGEIKGQLVESVMFTKEKQSAMGIPEGLVPQGWWCGFHIPDKEVFAKIKSGEYQMFSVEGSAIRKPTGQ